MAKIKIVDLPADMKISPEEMKKVFGGAPRTITFYPNPIDAVLMTEDPERLGYSNPLDTLDTKGRKIPVFCDPPNASWDWGSKTSG